MVCDFSTNRRIALAVSVTACAAWLLTVQSHNGGSQVAGDFVSSSRMLSSLAGEDDPVHELFPLQTLDYVGFVCAIAGLILSAGAGIGGGGILLPVFILIFKFPIKHAIPLTAVTVLGGAVANNVLNARKTHPKHPNRPAIDWDLIIQLEPMTIAGALIGAGLNNVLPDTVLVVMLFLLLTTTAYKTLQKASQLHAQESEERHREQPLQETAALYQSSNKKEVEEGSDPTDRSRYGAIDPSSSQGSINLDHKKQSSLVWMSAVKLSALFGTVTLLNLLKGKPGNDGGGPLGYCGLHCFWIAEFSMIAIIVVFAIHTRSSILNRVRSGGPILSDIEWDADKTITYPLLAIVAGLVAGLFGVGGGIIKGPLMLALGKCETWNSTRPVVLFRLI